MSNELKMLNLILETITRLRIELATPKYGQVIIEDMMKTHPEYGREEIERGLRKFWLTD